MEDDKFWDDLAGRLREEQPQHFEEEDWATVYRQLRVQRKRRPIWFWPVVAGLLFLGNNLVWWLMWQYADNKENTTVISAQRDTVFLIRENRVSDTIWQQLVAPVAFSNDYSIVSNTGFKEITRSKNGKELETKADFTPEKEPVSEIVHPERTVDTLSRLPTVLAPVPDFAMTVNPIQLTVQAPIEPLKRRPSLLVEADAGHAWLRTNGETKPYAQQYGASAYLMWENWGAVAGIRRWQAFENPPHIESSIEIPVECENCPYVDFADKVRLNWIEFQFGLAYKLSLPNEKTSFYLSAMGQLRGRAHQYRSFYFEPYGGGDPFVVEDRYRQQSGLYWNGWNGKVSVVHRFKDRLGLYGGVEGRWPTGVTPSFMPPSWGLHLGLAWYVRH